ncbi:MAG: hypothetical protein NVS3B20_08190 [Polyangiales bacterium]
MLRSDRHSKNGHRPAPSTGLPPRGTAILKAHPPRGPEFTLGEFREFFAEVPAALAIKSCVRLKRMKELPLAGPILDVGCGNGLFARLGYSKVAAWGVEIDAREAEAARGSGAYARVIEESITTTKALPEGHFATALGMCSLEHVPDIASALRVIRRALAPLGLFYLIVPHKNWAAGFPMNRALRSLG